MNSNMAGNVTMNNSLPLTLDTADSVETAYSEIVNISLDNSVSKKFHCNLCDFKNNDKRGMKRHVTTKHKVLDSFKRKRDNDETDTQVDVISEDASKEKKSKNDSVFYPELTSTQKPNSVNNLTVSELSNESIANLFSDN